MAAISERELQFLLDALYEAAVDPSRWIDFLHRLTRATGGESAALVLHDFKNSSSSVTQHVGLSPDGTRKYAQHYYKHDVWTARARELGRPVLTVTSEELCPWSDFRQTEYYNDFLRHHDIAHGIFSMVKRSDSHITSLSIYRSAKREFTDAELQILQFLTPHVQRAFRVHSEVSRLRSDAKGWNAATDAVATPIFILGRCGTVLGMNAAAVSLISKKDGLLLTTYGVTAENTAEAHQLRHFAERATAAVSCGVPESVGALKLSRRLGAPLDVLVFPVPRSFDLGTDHKVLALIFVNDPDQKPLPIPSILQMLYGLTPAEARVALYLAKGQDLLSICGELSITYATARAHLRSTFQKLGVRRQAELASLILPLGSPSPRLK